MTYEWSKDLTLAIERNMLGLYVSGHPLDDYDHYIEQHVSATAQQVWYGEFVDGKELVMAGLLVDPMRQKTKKGYKVSGILEDRTGRIPMSATSFDGDAVDQLFAFGEDEPFLAKVKVSRYFRDSGEEKISVRVLAAVQMPRQEDGESVEFADRRNLLAFGHAMVAGGEGGSGSEFTDWKKWVETRPETLVPYKLEPDMYSPLTLCPIGPILMELPTLEEEDPA